MAGDPDPRSSYRFVVDVPGAGEARIHGSYTVDGRQVEIAPTSTPFEFRCEAGTTIAGTIRSESQRLIRVRVFDAGYSTRRPVAWVKAPAVRFAWARPGAGPRELAAADEGDQALPR
jgi:hypothetical protein